MQMTFEYDEKIELQSKIENMRRLAKLYEADSERLSKLNKLIMRSDVDIPVSKLLPGNWTDIRDAIDQLE